MRSNQVLSKDLVDPVCIGVFDNSGIGAEFRTARANELCGQLNRAGIKFACVNNEPPIFVYVEKRDWSRVQELNVRLPTSADRR